MKYITILAFLLTSFILVQAQQKKKKNVLIGVQYGVQLPSVGSKKSIKEVSLGIPSFSYAASIEKRFTIHNKLNFSLEYSMNYVRSTKNFQLNGVQNHIASSLSAKTYQSLSGNTNIFGGVGVMLPHSGAQSNRAYTCFPSQTAAAPKVSPYAVIGVENSTQLFRKNFVYSLQYQMGVNLQSSRRNFVSVNAADAQNNQSGFRIGLKYKY